jgi:PilZ domain
VASQSNAVLKAEERRASDRVDVALWGRIRFRGTSHPARICNLSPGGMMAMTPFALRAFSEIDIEIPVLGWRSGLVAWVKGDTVGIEFDPPLPHALFDRFATFQGK